MNRNKTTGVLVGTGLLLLTIAISTLTSQVHLTAFRSQASDYSLTLNNSNGISGSNVTTSQNITTDSGNYQVAFAYEKCSSLSSGHATILSGGTIKNSDHIRSIYSLSANFTTSGSLKFRTSYDGATWGGYTTMVSSQPYELSSNPYYVEFSTDGSHSVDVNQIKFLYTCAENPDAKEGEEAGDPVYQKISSTSELEDGQYLIVYESGSRVLNGAGTSSSNYTSNSNYQTVTITNNTIPSNTTTDSYSFTIASTGSGYSIKSAAGYYIGHGSSRSAAITANKTTVYNNTITLSSGSATIRQVSYTSYTLKYYSRNSVFKYYNSTSSSYTLPALYKLVNGAVQYDTPVDENGFAASDANINSYTTKSIFDNDNAITAYATLTDGSTKALTSADYSYVVTNSNNEAIDTSKAFPSGGTYKLSISYKNYFPIEYSFSVTQYVAVSSVSLSSSDLELDTGSTQILTATISPSNASNKNVTWSSSNTSIATVSDAGLVKGISEGTAVITATAVDNGKKATCNVTVNGGPLDAWTIMIYMCGADLESSYASSNQGLASGDLQEILNVSNKPDNVNIIIETGGASKWSSRYGISASYLERYEVSSSQTLTRKAQLTKADMGLTSTFQSFLEWGLTNYPAERTGLVLWNHGGALDGVCFDENFDNDSLTNDEVATALDGAFATVGRTENLTFIGYDACLMAVQEIAETNSHYFDYMVCSQENEGGYGWDYDRGWLASIYENPTGVETSTVCSQICDNFIADNSSSSTLSVLDLSKMSQYVTAWENLASGISGIVTSSSTWSTFKTCVNKSKKFGYSSSYTNYNGGYVYDIFDVQDFITNGKSSYSSLSSQFTALQTAFNNLVIYNKTTSDYSGAHGLNFFCPVSGVNLHDDYVYNGTTYAGCYTAEKIPNFPIWRQFVVSYGSWAV